MFTSTHSLSYGSISNLILIIIVRHYMTHGSELHLGVCLERMHKSQESQGITFAVERIELDCGRLAMHEARSDDREQ